MERPRGHRTSAEGPESAGSSQGDIGKFRPHLDGRDWSFQKGNPACSPSPGHPQKRTPVRLRTGVRELSVSAALGFPASGSRRFWLPGAPYEDATSTEPKRLLSNGSPPFRGFLMRRDPTLPIPQAARASGTARVCFARVITSEFCFEPAVFVNRTDGGVEPILPGPRYELYPVLRSACS
jgi:hypothetical protein